MTTTIPTGLTHTVLADGTNKVQCDDCGQSAIHDLETMRIRHSRRCDTPDLQVVVSRESSTPATNATAELQAARTAPVSQRSHRALGSDARQGAASLHSEDDVVGAVRAGWISVSDAMNRDF